MVLDAPRVEIETGRLAETQKAKTWTIIIVVTLLCECSTLQYSMVSPAAILIAPSFPGVGANISWMTTIFGLVGGVATPLAGKASDLWGKKRLLLISGALFVIGSVLCVVGHDWALFLVGRGFQALSLGNVAVSYGLFRDLLPRRYIPMSLGVIVTGFGLSAIAAPLLSGYLTDHNSWRSIFWFLLVYGALTLVLVALLVPETKYRVKQRLDVLGALILSGGVALCLVYLSNGPTWGWTSSGSLPYLAAGVVLIALFLPWERRVAEPIIDLPVLLNPKVLMTIGLYFFGSLAVGAIAYAVPLMLETPPANTLILAAQKGAAAQTHLSLAQTVAFLHISLNDGLRFAAGVSLIGVALHASLFQGGWSMLTGPGAGWWGAKRGPRKPALVGYLALLLAGVSLLTTSQHGIWFFALTSSLFGIGFGVMYACSPNLLIDAVPPRQQGISAGMLAVFGSLAAAVGSAVVTAFIYANPLILTVKAGGKTVSTVNLSKLDSLGTWHAFVGVAWVIVIAGALGLIVALVMKHGREPSSAGRVSEEL
ncbi:MFS transporter [Actinospica sp.]|jgi:MFS family permease|uniref:MFS transporter n=1 Tax=Actinospica sp. TaxID=1872142 RepID=UPI002BE7035B|nr:MFS transporter [Actinospica sp.]HWG26709.1 MFS transporter [Actinospica sp.]